MLKFFLTQPIPRTQIITINLSHKLHPWNIDQARWNMLFYNKKVNHGNIIEYYTCSLTQVGYLHFSKNRDICSQHTRARLLAETSL